MGTSVNVAGTLRTQEHGHQPIIFSAGFDPEMGAKARGIACEQEKAPTLTAQKIAAVLECEQPAAVQPEPLVMATARTKAEILTGTSPTILSGNERLIIAFTERGREGGRNCETLENVMYALTNPGAGGRTNSRQICDGSVCRRLTPLECERLQGFPDLWTAIPSAADSARYKALGNSIAVPCAEFILGGIAKFVEMEVLSG